MRCVQRLSISSAGNLPPSHLILDSFYPGTDWTPVRSISQSSSAPHVDDLSHRGRLYGSKYSQSQVVSLAESCSQASSTVKKRISGCTPKKGKPCHVMQRTVFMLRWAFLVRTLKWGSSETAEELLYVRRTDGYTRHFRVMKQNIPKKTTTSQYKPGQNQIFTWCHEAKKNKSMHLALKVRVLRFPLSQNHRITELASKKRVYC